MKLYDIKPSIKFFGSNRSEVPEYITDGAVLLVANKMKRWQNILAKRQLKAHEGLPKATAEKIAQIMPETWTQGQYQNLDFLHSDTTAVEKTPRAVYQAVQSGEEYHFDAQKIALLHHVFGLSLVLRGTRDNLPTIVENEHGEFCGLLMPIRKVD